MNTTVIFHVQGEHSPETLNYKFKKIKVKVNVCGEGSHRRGIKVLACKKLRI